MHEHLVTYSRAFHYAAVRRQVSFQHGKSACLGIRIVDRPYDFRIFIFTARDVLAHCLPGDCHAVCVEKSFLVQLIHDRVHAARLVEVFDICMPCRSEMAEVRGFLTDRIREVDLKVHADLMGDRREMEHTVRGTAQSHIHGQRVEDRVLCHDIPRPDVLPYQLHDLHTRMFCELQPCGIDRRDRAVSAQSHAQSLCQAVHAVGRVHTGAGTAGRARFIFILAEVFVRDLSCCMSTHSLKHAGKACLSAFDMSGQHRASADEDRRDIHARRCHKKAGHVFVAVRDHDQTVELVRHCQRFRRIRDQVSCHERIFHPDMSHRDAVADCDRRYHDRRASRHRDSHLHCLCDLIQVHMPRHDLIVGADHSDQRPVQLFLGHPKRIKQRSVRRLLDALCHCVTSHLSYLTFRYTRRSGHPSLLCQSVSFLLT